MKSQDRSHWLAARRQRHTCTGMHTEEGLSFMCLFRLRALARPGHPRAAGRGMVSCREECAHNTVAAAIQRSHGTHIREGMALDSSAPEHRESASASGAPRRQDMKHVQPAPIADITGTRAHGGTNSALMSVAGTHTAHEARLSSMKEPRALSTPACTHAVASALECSIACFIA